MSTPSRRGFVAGSLALAVSGPSTSPAAIPTATARLQRGISAAPWFSLTREFPAPRTDYAWPPYQTDRPVPRQADLAALKATGFDFVRIPIDPGPLLAFAGSRRSELLDDIFAAVRDTLAAGLSVILNIQPNESTHYWNSERLIAKPGAPQFSVYARLVKEIATGLKRFDQSRIALEPFNEPPQECGSGEWGNIQIELLTIARRAAPDLTLIATGACGGMARGLELLDPTNLKKLSPLLYTFHCYEPYVFSHQGATWMSEPMYKYLNHVPWPAAAGSLQETLDKTQVQLLRDESLSAVSRRDVSKQIDAVLREYFAAQPDRRFLVPFFASVSDWATKHQIPTGQILLGEFGALPSGPTGPAANPADRVRYLHDVRTTAESFGFAWAFWNLFEAMGLMDETTRVLDPDVLTALGFR